MSWHNKDDLGLALVGFVHDSLKISDKYRLDQGRGFTWWASDYAQTIWADMGIFHNMANFFRLHTEIEFLRCEGQAHECEVPLLEAMADANLSAMVYDREKDTYKLHCSVYACYENEDWLKRLFLGAVGLQICEVQHTAKSLASRLGVLPATSVHPLAGMREHADAMVEADERFFKPWGTQASRWNGSAEWEDARQAVKRISMTCTTDDQTQLTADFEWHHGGNGNPMRLTITSNEAHPGLGNGLSCHLIVPINMVVGSRAHLALYLNEMERKEWNWCNDIGSWCCRGIDLAFDCFVPNISFAVGVLPGLAHDMANRARWLDEQWESMLTSAATG
ncbi:MAG: hypothetical protein BGO01_03210 [Armatimonadetes bacterium 55-13]|nr:hypothetical protein [Armatimonadota bacterium]OJU63669.1 MAG: hypothetical protein BGO01_03210 [Armatimonadetes bacterium 55-13]